MSEPSRELVDRLTLEVIEAAGDSRDPNILITLAIKAGYQAARDGKAERETERRLASKVKALKASGLTVRDIAAAYGLGVDSVKAILSGR
jgi:hypothetical protein